MADVGESETTYAGAAAGQPPRALAGTCHEIIDAVSSIIVNVEFIAAGADGEKQEAAEDARKTLEKVVKLVKSLSCPPSAVRPG